MATSTELTTLYGELRTGLLTRHFALGRYFRANHLAQSNNLGLLRAPNGTAPPDKDELVIPACDGVFVARSTKAHTAAALLKLAPLEALVERWRIGHHGRENPLMLTGQLMICLAVECHLGRLDARAILRALLASIASLYKFGGPFKGYPVRWDAVTSDKWVTTIQNGVVTPRYCCDFLLNEDASGYLYCTPLQHPDYVPLLREDDLKGSTLEQKKDYHFARWRSLDFHRRWEPSQDELVGLVMGYDFAYRYAGDQSIKDEIKRQVNDLGDYLAEHGYLLVRPEGGFAARGASGALPAFEFPFQRVFERITGSRYEPRVGFEGACQKAGVWDCLVGPLTWSTLVGLAGSVLVALLLAAALGLVGVTPIVTALSGVIAGLLSIPVSVIAARAWVIYSHADCFDVWGWPRGAYRPGLETATTALISLPTDSIPVTATDGFSGDGVLIIGSDPGFQLVTYKSKIATAFTQCSDGAGKFAAGTRVRQEIAGDSDSQLEFLLAYFLKKIFNTKWRFNLAFGWLGDHVDKGSAAGFPPFLGLTGLDDEDATVRDAYLKWLPERRKHPELDPPDSGRDPQNDPWPSAVAVVLEAKAGADQAAEENKLVENLNKGYEQLVETHKRDHQIDEAPNEPLVEDIVRGLGWMTALALAWLHSKRRQDAGAPVPADVNFPEPPSSTLGFPPLVAPKSVRDDAAARGLPLSVMTNAPDATDELPSGSLFAPPSASETEPSAPPAKAPEPKPAAIPSSQKHLVYEWNITVGEGEREADTGIDIRAEDEYVLEGSGQIHSGMPWPSGWNGPEGWDSLASGSYPLPQGRRYSLIGRLGSWGSWFYVGKRYPATGRQIVGMGVPTRRLYLRTNDDVPGNGQGSFKCRVMVWRA